VLADTEADVAASGGRVLEISRTLHEISTCMKLANYSRLIHTIALNNSFISLCVCIHIPTLSAVRLEGVRSADPPKISGRTDAAAFRTSSERLRVATALAS
jgi:hypothetical protein